MCVRVCALQHGTLCHCDGSRPEQWKEAAGGKREDMNIARVGEQIELYHSMYSMSVHVFAYVQLACKDVLTL